MERSIKSIDASSVHRICSGQVILDPSSALKEVVENSIDAGSTRIDVRLREFGLEQLEVCDNGLGIKPEDYELLAGKHTTSKLSQFEDITRLATFGFRGEALSSLCAISERVTIVTRTKDQSVGTKLEYDKSGKLKSTSSSAREVGTTIILDGLFQSLPVRYKDFMKNKTREYQRLLRRLQAYALIHTNVRFSCSNQTAKGRANILSTPGSGKMLDAITSVFGARMKDTLTEIDLKVDDNISLCGMISKASAGSGMSSTDRQFLFLNRRPVDIPKLAKAINEVYKSFNMHQYPTYVLNMSMPPDAYDVNVTPDKRQVMIHQERHIVEAVKELLNNRFEPSRGTMAVSSTPIDRFAKKDLCSRSSVDADALLTLSPVETGPLEDLRPSDSHSALASATDGTDVVMRPDSCHEADTDLESKSLPMQDVVEDNSAGDSLCAHDDQPPPDTEEASDTEHVLAVDSTEKRAERSGRAKISVDLAKNSKHSRSAKPSGRDLAPDASKPKPGEQSSIAAFLSGRHKTRKGAEIIEEDEDDEPEAIKAPKGRPARGCKRSSSPVADQPSCSDVESVRDIGHRGKTKKSKANADDDNLVDGKGDEDIVLTNEGNTNEVDELRVAEQASTKSSTDMLTEANEALVGAQGGLATDGEEGGQVGATTMSVAVDWDTVAHQAQSAGLSAPEPHPLARADACRGRVDESSTDLQMRVIAKEDFLQMKIVGQFNLGFIIAQLRGDLYILDQHACDEKYRFETLQQSLRLNTQRLVAPYRMELEAADELVVAENLEVLRANGFDVAVDEAAPAGERVRLVAVPLSKGTVFGPNDVHEMVCLLREAPGVLCRPSRVTAMLASRACRSAVMIGTSVSERGQRELVDHMASMDQPWNCPHGRPTMRHLYHLSAHSPSAHYTGPGHK